MRTTCTYTECPDYGCHCLQSQLTELQAENMRLLTLATKHCPIAHRDFDELRHLASGSMPKECDKAFSTHKEVDDET